MVKLRLSRQGRTHAAHYSIVVADVRAPRDGRFIEKVGTFDPRTNPGTVHMKVGRVLYWLNEGAQPTPRVRSLCSNGGLMLFTYLMNGIRRGKTDKTTIKKRFTAWEDEVAKRKSPKVNFIGTASVHDLIEALPATPVQPKKRKAPKKAKTTPKKTKSKTK